MKIAVLGRFFGITENTQTLRNDAYDMDLHVNYKDMQQIQKEQKKYNGLVPQIDAQAAGQKPSAVHVYFPMGSAVMIRDDFKHLYEVQPDPTLALVFENENKDTYLINAATLLQQAEAGKLYKNEYQMDKLQLKNFTANLQRMAPDRTNQSYDTYAFVTKSDLAPSIPA